MPGQVTQRPCVLISSFFNHIKSVGPKQISHAAASALSPVLMGDQHSSAAPTPRADSHLALSSFHIQFHGSLPCAGGHREEEANKLALLSAFNFGEGDKRPETLWADPSSANMSQIMSTPVQSLSLWIQLQRPTTARRLCSSFTAIWVSLPHCYSVKYKLRFPRANNRSEFGIETLYLGIPRLESCGKR